MPTRHCRDDPSRTCTCLTEDFPCRAPTSSHDGVDDEVVLVNLQTNRIFALNPTGARFWELLEGGAGRAEIEETLARRVRGVTG